MGMFDRVKYEESCYECGEALDEFQTKDGPCRLITFGSPYSLLKFATEFDGADTVRFYALCSCGTMNNFRLDQPRIEREPNEIL